LEVLQNRYDIVQCPHIKKQTGFTKHMYVKEHPLLVNFTPLENLPLFLHPQHIFIHAHIHR